MNFAKRISSAAAALTMTAVCLTSGAQMLFADDALALGDVNSDAYVNASDAAQILIAAAKLGAGGESGLTSDQESVSDINSDGIINASDAALVLVYAAYVGAGGKETIYEYYKIETEPVNPGPTEPGTEPGHEDPTDTGYNGGNWRIGAASASPGDIVKMPVTAANIGTGLNSFIVALELDPSLTLVNVEDGDAGFALCINDAAGKIAGTKFNGVVDAKIPDNTVLFYINLRVAEDVPAGTSLLVKFSEISTCSIEMKSGTVSTSNGRVDVS